MSSIFLSHSSIDNTVAEQVKARLTDWGHQSVFLDFDPADGIPAGRDWEKELYARLRECRAVIILCSHTSMASRWCFAEIAYAKALGKQVFPIKIDDSRVDSVLTDKQIIDATRGWDEAYQRLENGLCAAGLNPRDLFAWDNRRPPYPGLLAFQEQDSAIFFGRDKEIREGQALLNRLQQFGGPRLTLMLGASGSGKSSLVRAGLLPRLKRDPRWLVIDPFRPLNDPFDELAKVLSKCFRQVNKSASGVPATLKPVLDAIRWRKNDKASGVDAFLEVIKELCETKDPQEVTPLLTIDQCEELLGFSIDEEGHRFLPFLRAVLDREDSQLMLLATLRSDFLGSFQDHPALRGLTVETFAVRQMDVEDFSPAIEGPAQVAGLQLGPGLVQALVRDTKTSDALPLLAFTLRELWEGFRDDTLLTLNEYRDKLGGLEGSITRAAEAVLKSKPLSEKEFSDLRIAFLSMARISDKDQYARQPAQWKDLPTGVHGALERFVTARLLVSSGDENNRTLEVAHESLFRAWPRLANWLQDNKPFLAWRKRFEESAKHWEESGHDSDLLLRRGPLAEAEDWVAKRSIDLQGLQRAFFTTSISERAREEEAAEQEQRRLRLQVGRFFASSARSALYEMPHRALLLSVEAVRYSHTSETEDVLRTALANTGGMPLRDHSGPAFAVTFDLQQRWLASGGSNGKTYLWTLNALDGIPKILVTPGGSDISALAFDPRGRWLASADLNGAVLWSTEDFSQAPVSVPMPYQAPDAFAVAFDHNGQWLAVGCNRRLLFFSIDDTKGLAPKPCAIVKTSAEVVSIAFDPLGRWVAFVNDESDVFVWPLAGLKANGRKTMPPRVLPGGKGVARCVAIDPQSRYIATGGETEVCVWSIAALNRAPKILRSQNGEVTCIGFAPDGERLAVGTINGCVWFIDLADGGVTSPLHFHENAVNALACDASGSLLASAGNNGVRIWQRNRSQDEPCLLLRFNPPKVDGHTIASNLDSIDDYDLDRQTRWLAEGCEDGTLRVVALAVPNLVTTFQAAGTRSIVRVQFDPLNRWLASLGRDATVYLWPLPPRIQTPLIVRHRKKVPATALAFDPLGHFLALGFKDGNVLIWNLHEASREPRYLREVPGEIKSLAFDPKDRWLAIASDDVYLWSFDKRESPPLQLYGGPPQPNFGIADIAFDPMGRWLATSWFDGYLYLWATDAPEEGPLLLEENTPGAVLGLRHRLAFSADGKWLASLTNDRSVILWQLSDSLIAKQAELPFPHLGHGRTVAFDPLSRGLIVVTENGRVFQWTLDVEVLCRKACLMAGRELTEEECQFYFGNEAEYRRTRIDDSDK